MPKVRNTHAASVMGIQPGCVADVPQAAIDRYPWALRPVDEPEPAQAEAGPRRTPARAQIELLRKTDDLEYARSFRGDDRASVHEAAVIAMRRLDRDLDAG